MRKLILLNALLTLTFGYSQNATKAALMSIEIEKKRQEKICFEKKIKSLKKKGELIYSSQVGSSSTAIEYVEWYKLNNLIYALVNFKQNIRTNEDYIYGGWQLSLKQLYVIKSSFEEANSKGRFFLEYIKPHKISCDYYESLYDWLDF